MKKVMRYLIVFGVLVGVLAACGTTREVDPSLMVVKGVLKEQGITTYQYGTYTLSGEDGFFALSSKQVDLAPYVDQEVEIRATKISGYPVDGGPVYLQVQEVKEL